MLAPASSSTSAKEIHILELTIACDIRAESEDCLAMHPFVGSRPSPRSAAHSFSGIVFFSEDERIIQYQQNVVSEPQEHDALPRIRIHPPLGQ
jgi:hypothetical protein